LLLQLLQLLQLRHIKLLGTVGVAATVCGDVHPWLLTFDTSLLILVSLVCASGFALPSLAPQAGPDGVLIMVPTGHVLRLHPLFVFCALSRVYYSFDPAAAVLEQGGAAAAGSMGAGTLMMGVRCCQQVHSRSPVNSSSQCAWADRW
jgi:hypothetical protein